MKKFLKRVIIVVVLLLCFNVYGKLVRKDNRQTVTPTPASGQSASVSAAQKPAPQKPVIQAEEKQLQPASESYGGIRPEFKAAMDSYEAFYDEYCSLMQRYMNNPADISILADYAEMLSRAEEMDRRFAAWDQDDMSPEELKYYLELSTRIEKRLIDMF